MVTGNDILGYQGNVGLGLSEGGGINSYGDVDTKELNASMFNMAYLNLQKNKAIWEQKIKDRDEGMAAIAAGKLDINNVLPQHRKELQDQIDGIKKIYFDNGGDVKSDPKVWLDLQDKLARFNSANVSAKTSLDVYNNGMAEAANEPNPVAQANMIQHWKDESQKKATDIFEPFQKTMDWDSTVAIPDFPMIGDAPAMNPVTTRTTTTYPKGGTQTTTKTGPAGAPARGAKGAKGVSPLVGGSVPATAVASGGYMQPAESTATPPGWRAPMALPDGTAAPAPQPEQSAAAAQQSGSYREGNYDVTRRATDIDQSWLNYATAYQNNDMGLTTPNIDGFYKSYYGQDGLQSPAIVAQRVALQNQKWLKIAQLNGYKTDTPEDIAALPEIYKPTKLAFDNTPGGDGKLKPTDTIPMAAFKAAMPVKYQNGEVRTYNEDYAKDAKGDAEIKKLNAETEAARALALQRKSLIPYNHARARYWNSKGSETQNADKIANIFQDITARSKIIDFNVNTRTATTLNGKKTVVTSSVPVQKEVVWAADMPPGFPQVVAGVDNKGVPVLLRPLKLNGADYYEIGKSPYVVNQATGSRISQAQLQNSYKNQDTFKTYDEFINNITTPVAKGGKGWTQEKELIGANGRGTAEATIQALRILNNKSRSGKIDEPLTDPGDNNQQDQTQAAAVR